MDLGRPSIYTLELAQQICELTAQSNKSLKTICKELGIGHSTVTRWKVENDDFREIYARAKMDQADLLAEEIIEIADDSSQDLAGIDEHGNRIENKEFVNRSKLRVDARKWVASKLKPKTYGDRLELDADIHNDTPINQDMVAAIAAKLNMGANQ